MALCDDCFEDFVHPLSHELMEKNNRFREQYGMFAQWDWDPESATLTFIDPKKTTLRIAVSVVGTTEGNSWEWTWANRNFEPHTKIDIDKVRVFGEVNGFEKLTTAFLEAAKYTGWEMTSIAAHILDARGAYRFPRDEGGHCYLIYRKVEELENSAH